MQRLRSQLWLPPSANLLNESSTEGLARLLDDAGFEVVAGAATPTSSANALRSELPDVVIVDIRPPPTHTDDGLRAAVELRAAHPGLAVLVLSQYVELGLAMKLLADSAEGRLPAQGPHQRRARLPGGGQEGGGRRLSGRPDDRVDPAVAATTRRPARPADATGAGGTRAYDRQAQAYLRFDALDRLGAITAPTLVIVGEQDLLTPPWIAREVASGIPGARFEIVTGDGSSHVMPLERADDFNQLVMTFLDE